MVEPTPITDAGLAELERTIAGHERMGTVRIMMLLETASSLVHRLRTSEARVKELEAERDRRNSAEMDSSWRETGLENSIDLLKARAEKAEAEVARLRAAVRAEMACLLRGGMTARMEAIAGLDAALATSRPDPAPPVQSSAQPAAECAIQPQEISMDINTLARAARLVVQMHEAHCDNIGETLEDEDAVLFAEAKEIILAFDRAAPPAAGSAAGKGE